MQTSKQQSETAVPEVKEVSTNVGQAPVSDNSVLVLLGDIGGTNARFQLVDIDRKSLVLVKEVKKDSLKVQKFPSFQSCFEEFFNGCNVRPKVAVIAIAGPVKDNGGKMSNALHWGQLNGYDLAKELKVDHFIILNDFEAAAYGASLVPEDDLIKITDVPVRVDKVKCVVGPGTGLGIAMLFSAPFRSGHRSYVIPGEGGHVNFAPVNQTQIDFYNYLKKVTNSDHLVLQRIFCGPAIPHMFRFFAEKHPQRPQSKLQPTSEQIIQKGLTEEDSLYRMSLDLFLDIYTEFLGDTAIRTLCYGGLYLVGSLTLSVADYVIKHRKPFFDKYLKHRTYLESVLTDIPVVVTKHQDLGLFGAYVFARRVVHDMDQ